MATPGRPGGHLPGGHLPEGHLPNDSGLFPSRTIRIKLRRRRRRRIFVSSRR